MNFLLPSDRTYELARLHGDWSNFETVITSHSQKYDCLCGFWASNLISLLHMALIFLSFTSTLSYFIFVSCQSWTFRMLFSEHLQNSHNQNVVARRFYALMAQYPSYFCILLADHSVRFVCYAISFFLSDQHLVVSLNKTAIARKTLVRWLCGDCVCVCVCGACIRLGLCECERIWAVVAAISWWWSCDFCGFFIRFELQFYRPWPEPGHKYHAASSINIQITHIYRYTIFIS